MVRSISRRSKPEIVNFMTPYLRIFKLGWMLLELSKIVNQYLKNFGQKLRGGGVLPPFEKKKDLVRFHNYINFTLRYCFQTVKPLSSCLSLIRWGPKVNGPQTHRHFCAPSMAISCYDPDLAYIESASSSSLPLSTFQTIWVQRNDTGGSLYPFPQDRQGFLC